MSKSRHDFKVMTFGEHLEELRWRLIRSLIAVAVAFIVCWIFKQTIMQIVLRPHRLAMSALGLPTELQQIRYQEGFYAFMRACFVASLFFSMPWCLHEAWAFVSAGLYPHEQRYVKLYAPVSFSAFLLGCLFGYFFLVPLGLRFLASISLGVAVPRIAMGDYVSLFFILTLLLGLVFQLPLIMKFATKIGVISADKFVEYRRHAILATFIMAGVLTPPDVFTQLMVAVPSVMLYEVGILLSRPTKAQFVATAKAAGLVALGAAAVWGVLHFRHGQELRVKGTVEITVHGKTIEASGELLRYRKNALITVCDDMAVFQIKAGKVYARKGTRLRFLKKQRLIVEKGEILAEAKVGDKPFSVHTPDCDIDFVRGRVWIRVTDEGTRVAALDKKNDLRVGQQTLQVGPGRERFVSKWGAPISPRDIPSWVPVGKPEADSE